MTSGVNKPPQRSLSQPLLAIMNMADLMISQPLLAIMNMADLMTLLGGYVISFIIFGIMSLVKKKQ